MSNIDKQALIAKIKNQTESYDTVVLRDDEANALLDELEAKDSTIATQQQEIRTLLNALGQASEKRNAEQAGIIAKQEKWIKDVEETMISATDRAEAAEKLIAELEASHSNLREAMAGIHNTISGGGAYTPLAAILNASKRAYEESAAAAGKGEAL
ncbi:hypothetical protein [Enterobacter mori]|uniref:hypothetical protein n=1 Tax=Enterobacter mori TaxID=539813 RepID=UPI0020321F5B|nr:hypothetical protein [Enterobacter mori]MCW4856089.1 hypothetical protein [Enterobacter mori]